MSAANSSITYLAIDANGETQWNSPLYDLAAVEQAILTRLRLLQGEWWADLADGLPLWQSILAQAASPQALNQMELLISVRITGTPFVSNLANISVTFNKATRQFSFSAVANTQFGQVAISNFPIPAGVNG